MFFARKLDYLFTSSFDYFYYPSYNSGTELLFTMNQLLPLQLSTASVSSVLQNKFGGGDDGEGDSMAVSH